MCTSKKATQDTPKEKMTEKKQYLGKLIKTLPMFKV